MAVTANPPGPEVSSPGKCPDSDAGDDRLPAIARCDLCPGLDRRKDGLIAVVATAARLAEGHDNWG
jgi:hypothetical protein